MVDTFKRFVKSEQTGGILLIACTVVSLYLANSDFSETYQAFWKISIGLSLEHWINDGFMAVFFLLVGLEIKREVLDGELSTPGKALLPVIAAFGGMVVPALFFVGFNHDQPTYNGWGIPMATDIAFALGIMALLGDRIPTALKVFLVAVAVVDDLGAILVIALFYAHEFNIMYFMGGMAVLALLITLNGLKVKAMWAYIALGILLWVFILNSGVHATIAGVLLAFTIPVNHDHDKSLLHKMEHSLSRPVGLFIMPIFALANTAILIQGNVIDQLSSSESLGIITGLLLGKPVGIILMAGLVVLSGKASLPDNTNWGQLMGAAFLGGIGFTMSIFISNLAYFDELQFLQASKISILVGSLLAAVVGIVLLAAFTKGSEK